MYMSLSHSSIQVPVDPSSIYVEVVVEYNAEFLTGLPTTPHVLRILSATLVMLLKCPPFFLSFFGLFIVYMTSFDSYPFLELYIFHDKGAANGPMVSPLWIRY